MKYGKIRVENGNFYFFKRMMVNTLPCCDIVWAYKRRESPEEGESDDASFRQVITNYLVIYTRRQKQYKFDMTEREVDDCINILKTLNPEMMVGFPAGDRIGLQGLNNTRDLGAILTKDDRHILPQKLLRSGDLYHLSQLDRDILLDEYRVKTVIDLRCSKEKEERPDSILKGVEYYHVPLFEDEEFGRVESFASVDHQMKMLGQDPFENRMRFYEKLVSDPYSVQQLAKFYDILLHHEQGAVLWHGSFGKDRTGVVTAILLSILGVQRKSIREDFMKTNRFLNEDMDYMIRYKETNMIVDALTLERIRTLYKVQETYLNRVFRTVDLQYGSMSNFLKKGLYLSAKSVEDLKKKYLI
ncbi:MAG: tyrosine-protein phosphatase [Blautia sp.]|nr:tyrosine-protein phosphatase [Blautia sp.]